jgi:hypothetical protein
MQLIKTGDRGKGPYRSRNLEALEAGTAKNLFQHTINLNRSPSNNEALKWLFFISTFFFCITALIYITVSLCISYECESNPDDNDKDRKIAGRIKIPFEVASALLGLQILSL